MMNFHHHVDLLLRWDRGLMLKQQVQSMVQPGMRLLDAGTGSGIVALWAAQAGADVVGVDMADVSLARSLAEANGLGDRATFVQADLTEVTAEQLGGRFDAMTAMVYYNDPRRDEGQSRLVSALRDRLLTTDPLLLPDHVVYHATLCAWHDQDITTKHRTLRSHQSELEGRYGLGFEPLVTQALAQPHPSWFPVRRPDGGVERPGARFLSDPTPVATVDYRTDDIAYPPTLDISVVVDGMATCVLWAQELRHGEALIFRNESVSWLNQPKRVARGDKLSAVLDDRWRSTNLLSAGNR